MTEFRSGSFALVVLALIMTGSLVAQDVGLKPSEEDVRANVREWAYTSPIWYGP